MGWGKKGESPENGKKAPRTYQVSPPHCRNSMGGKDIQVKYFTMAIKTNRLCIKKVVKYFCGYAEKLNRGWTPSVEQDGHFSLV